MQLNDFDFVIPLEQIAQDPIPTRPASRMLLKTKTGDLFHKNFSDLLHELEPGTVLINNNSKVFFSRLFGQTGSGAACEVFLLQTPEGAALARVPALGKPLKKILKSEQIFFEANLVATILGVKNYGSSSVMDLEFNVSKEELMGWLQTHAHLPLPPYIKRKADEKDHERYQNIYADQTGSVAAPTAGLHFDEDFVKALKQKGVIFAPITLHVGAGTFLPIKSENIDDHVMHEETYFVPKSSLEAILHAQKEGRKVIFIGTTAMRTMESFALLAKKQNLDPIDLTDTWHQTNLFLKPSSTDDLYRPFWADGLLTNFHQPKSSLFVLMCALFGRKQMLAIYEEAVKKQYRFFSYGDCGLYWF